MQCDMASRPVAAVREGGRPSVRSGSQIATEGIRCGLIRPSFRPSAMTTTEPRPTSEPVPAVVGMATSGGMSAVMRSTPPSAMA